MTEVVIPLTKGKFAHVSAEDAERVSVRKWYATQSKAGIWYARAKIGDRIESMHRFILSLRPGQGVVDHVDCDGLNNTRPNIRLVTAQQNASRRASRRGPYLRGAFPHHRGHRWVSYITCNGRKRYLGSFASEGEASAAYFAAAATLFGDFAPDPHLALLPQQGNGRPLIERAGRFALPQAHVFQFALYTAHGEHAAAGTHQHHQHSDRLIH